MNHRLLKLLEEDPEYFYYDFDYECDCPQCSPNSCNNYIISYEVHEGGLVDWSDEIPNSVKRQKKIDDILNNDQEDFRNNLEKFWPK
jgi:hypothetical protein